MICDVHGVEGCKSLGCQIWLQKKCAGHIYSGITGDAGYCCKCGAEKQTIKVSASEGIVFPEGSENIEFGNKNFTFTIDAQHRIRIVPDDKPKGFQNIILSWIDRHIWIEIKPGSTEPPKRVWRWKIANNR